MSEIKITPGPWKAEPDPKWKGHAVVTSARYDADSPLVRIGASIVTIAPWGDGEEETMWADAHLIAAAPELYEALHRAFKELMWAYDNMDAACLKFAADQAREALAKARGETQ